MLFGRETAANASPGAGAADKYGTGSAAHVCPGAGGGAAGNGRSYGCQQNVADSEKLKGQLEQMGFSFTEDETQADLILFNTCAVRENAEYRVYGNVGNLKNIKREKRIFDYCSLRLHDGAGACGRKKSARAILTSTWCLAPM